MSGDLMIEARGLTRRFGDRTAVNGVDLEIRRGESLALFGPNGSGKTTLLRLLTSALKPSAGSFTIAGLDPRVADREARRILGALYHQTFLYDDLSARDNLLFFARLYGASDADRRAESLLAAVGLAERADDPVRSFSRGMQQRVSLARCLIHEPRVVILDEPFTGLDPHSAATFTETLQTMRSRGRTLLLVTHNLQRGLDLCDRWLILNRGRIVAEGSSAGVDRSAFDQIYLDRIREPVAGGAEA